MSGDTDSGIFVGKSTKPEYLLYKFANRHGLITGATGTGKTVTLQILAEGFSRAGVPVFAADVKGDLAGLAEIGVSKPFLEKRAADIGLADYKYEATPTILWDLFGQQGHPIRTSIGSMGALLLSRLMELNETQEGVLNIAFKLATDEGTPLVDLKDLRALMASVSERASELSKDYGNVTKASVGSIQRRLLVLEEQKGELFFGAPGLDIKDFMKTDGDGRGFVNILAADKLMESPRLYGTFLLWLMSELFDKLPEVGDLDKPKLIFFFDEAHLLFTEAPKALLERIERVTRLIRSKGVGVYYITQNPMDVPDKVSAQLGNRVQHALRAFTQKEQKAVRAAAETFRANPDFEAETAILELGTGEALVSFLEGKGEPSIVQRTFIRSPQSRLGPLTPAERQTIIDKSPVSGKYDEEEVREAAPARSGSDDADGEHDQAGEFRIPRRNGNGEGAEPARQRPPAQRRTDGYADAAGKSIIRSVIPAAIRLAERYLRGRLK